VKKNLKIVIISKVIYPKENPRANRTTELVKELAQQGHDVSVYAVLGEYDYSEFEQKHNVRVRNLVKMFFSKINSNKKSSKSFLEKVFTKLLKRVLDFPDIEIMFKIPKILKKEKKIDLLISIANPHSIHWGVTLFKKFNKKKNIKCWVADCGDPFMGNEVIKKPFFYFKYVEKWFCKKVDYITVPIEKAKNAYYKEFHDKIKVIPQGFNIESISKYKTNHTNKIPHFAYAGLLYSGSRDPSLLLEFLSQLKNLDFRCYIYTTNLNLVEAYKKKLGEKLIISSYIPREELFTNLAKMDFLINFDNQVDVQSPSKLIEYTILDKPILSINNSKFSENTILEFLSSNFENKYEMDDISKYDIKVVAKNFISIYKINSNQN